ncbi:hypothetical protein BYT27DRAFT_7213908 [Phlegmacium glaucopus]|nr:hypothetical protein BYT27DRAFT_7213908 [Phlegmacium glaucopus]
MFNYTNNLGSCKIGEGNFKMKFSSAIDKGVSRFGNAIWGWLRLMLTPTFRPLMTNVKDPLTGRQTEADIREDGTVICPYCKTAVQLGKVRIPNFKQHKGSKACNENKLKKTEEACDEKT